MEAYLWTFVNYEQNNRTRLLLMAEFAYNNAKNASTDHIPFELNYGYFSRVFYEENINPYSKLKAANKLLTKFQKLIIVYKKNIYYIQKLQKQVYEKAVKPRSYTLSNKVWLNSKYFKIKQNCKLESKFFELF